jgi:hypothetical protein
MVKVERRIRAHKDGRMVEAKALFDTGSRGSYFSRRLAEKMRFEVQKGPREVPLAVGGMYAELVGWAVVELEVEGYLLPEGKVLGAIDGPLTDAIIGLNIIEKYDVQIEGDEIKFKQVPPTSMII